MQAQVRVGRVSASRFLGFEGWWQRWAGRRFCARVLQPSLSTLPDAHRGMALLRHKVVFKRFLQKSGRTDKQTNKQTHAGFNPPPRNPE